MKKTTERIEVRKDGMECPYGYPVPMSLIQIHQLTFKVKKGEAAGIRTNNMLTVTKIDIGGAAESEVKFGDCIRKLNDVDVCPDGKANRQLFVETFRKLNTTDFTCEMTVYRPVTTTEAASRLEKVKKLPGFIYKVAVMFSIPGCKLALCIRGVDNKVYVSQVTEFTLAGRCLLQGDAILDVNETPVTGNKQCSDKIMEGLQSKGYVTMVIEQPEDILKKAQVRNALLQDKTVDMDPPLPPDVNDICQREVNRYKKEPEMKPKKEVLHGKDYKTRPDASRVKLEEQAQDTPIVSDRNPLLLINVPSAPPSTNYQSLAALSQSNK